MTNVKKMLDLLGFDWDSGKIIWQRVDNDSCPGWGTPACAEIIAHDHDILVKEFSDGYGSPKCPRIVAEDKAAIYFPIMYDGNTWFEKIYKNINQYLDWKNYESPYFGV